MFEKERLVLDNDDMYLHVFIFRHWCVKVKVSDVECVILCAWGEMVEYFSGEIGGGVSKSLS